MTDPITLHLEMTPDRRLAPNRMYRGNGFHARAALIAAERHKAWVSAGVDYDTPITEPVTVTVTIHWGKSLKAGKKRARIEQDRRLDWDSATALCKPMIDGALVDTGILQDDRLIVAGTVWQEVAEDGDGFTVIRIERAVAAREEAA